MLRVLIPLGSLCVATALAAAPERMSGQAVREAVIGATIEIDTPLGTKLPMRFADDGQVYGEAPNLAFYLGSESDTGRWWIAGDLLCQKWARWFDGEPQCLELKQDGQRYLWRRTDGKTGTATISGRSRPVSQVAAAAATPETPVKTMPAKGPTIAAANRMADATPRIQARAIAPRPVQIATNVSPREAVATRPAVAPAAAKPARPAATAAAVPAPAPTPIVVDPSFRVAGVDEFDVLYVRGGPSTDFAPVGSIPPQGRGIKIVGQCRLEWCPIKHREIGGWVNRYYLTEDAPMQQSARPTTRPTVAR